MTIPIYIAVIGHGRWCRLLTIGVTSHVTACRARVDAAEPILLTALPPGPICSACSAQRAEPDVYAIELGLPADVEADDSEHEDLLDIPIAPVGVT